LQDAVVILTCVFSNKHHSQLPAGLCQQVGVVPAALAEPAAEASEPAEVGYLIFSVSKMLRVSHAAHNLLDAVVILICAASNKHQSQLPARLCQQVGVVPAALAEPEAEASVPAEVGYLICCMSEMPRVSHTAPHILC